MSKRFELVLYTAASKEYAKSVIQVLDPRGKLFSHRLFRDSCLETSFGFTKPLEPLNRDMNKIILVDNTPFCMVLNPDNGINISSYINSDSDDELEKLAGLLRVIEGSGDTSVLADVTKKQLDLRRQAGTSST